MSNIKALNLIVNYPIIQVLSESNTVYSNLLDTISIYYINDYVVYQLSAVRQYESSNKVLVPSRTSYTKRMIQLVDYTTLFMILEME